MNKIKYTTSLEGLEYYETHLHIINPLLPVKLTPMEIRVISAFLSLPEVIKSIYTFSSTAKKYVIDELDISPSGLSNYFKDLINKGALVRDEHTKLIYINEFLIPDNNKQEYNFKLINNG